MPIVGDSCLQHLADDQLLRDGDLSCCVALHAAVRAPSRIRAEGDYRCEVGGSIPSGIAIICHSAQLETSVLILISGGLLKELHDRHEKNAVL